MAKVEMGIGEEKNRRLVKWGGYAQMSGASQSDYKQEWS